MNPDPKTTDHATLLACYRSGQITEAAWQEHLKDEGLRAYVDAQRPVVRLDPKALEAAAKAIRNDIWQSEPNPTTERYVADLRQQAMDQAEAAVRAYLSAAVPADVAGLVAKANEHVDMAKSMGNFGVASQLVAGLSAALVSMSAELAAKDALINGIDEERRSALDLCVERNKEIQSLQAALAEARKALEPFAAADRAIGDESGPFRFETGTGHRLIERDHLRAARRAHKGGEDNG